MPATQHLPVYGESFAQHGFGLGWFALVTDYEGQVVQTISQLPTLAAGHFLFDGGGLAEDVLGFFECTLASERNTQVAEQTRDGRILADT